MYGSSVYACDLRPFRYTPRNAVKSKLVNVVGVACLFHRCRPPAVCLPALRDAIRTVPTPVAQIVVFAFNGAIRRRARPHVGVKSGKLQPSLTHGDAPAAVTIIPISLRIETTLLHSSPGIPFQRPVATMNPRLVPGRLPLEAAATVRSPQIGCRNCGAPSAGAVAEPQGVAIAITANKFHHCETVEFLPNQISFRIAFSHTACSCILPDCCPTWLDNSNDRLTLLRAKEETNVGAIADTFLGARPDFTQMPGADRYIGGVGEAGDFNLGPGFKNAKKDVRAGSEGRIEDMSAMGPVMAAIKARGKIDYDTAAHEVDRNLAGETDPALAAAMKSELGGRINENQGLQFAEAGRDVYAQQQGVANQGKVLKQQFKYNAARDSAQLYLQSLYDRTRKGGILGDIIKSGIGAGQTAAMAAM